WVDRDPLCGAADFRGDRTARDRVFQLPADDCGVSDGRGILHGRQREPGEGAGLLAGAALMINYLLNVAVGISAGIGALVSAVPSLEPPIVLVPVDRFNAATEKALQFALTLSPDVQAVHVTCDSDEGEPPWKWAENPPPETPAPKLVTLPSPFRLVVHPIVDYVLKVERENPERTVAVVIASMVELHWYHYFLHNQRGQMLTALLL